MDSRERVEVEGMQDGLRQKLGKGAPRTRIRESPFVQVSACITVFALLPNGQGIITYCETRACC